MLLISEDPFEYVLTPRLIEMGADLDRVSYLSWSAMARYQLGDTTFLDEAYRQMAPLALVAIDPPTNFLGGKDEHKNSEVRAMLMNLVGWLNGRNTACILITHVNKSTGKGTEALSRVIGSVAWTTTSRVAHAFVADADRPGHALFVPMKSNLGLLPKGLSFRIASTETFARVEWAGQVETTADEAMSGEKQPAPSGRESRADKIERARVWLLECFREQPTWTSEELCTICVSQDLGKDHVWEAKRLLGIKSKKSKERDGEWFWSLPERSDSSTVRDFEGNDP